MNIFGKPRATDAFLQKSLSVEAKHILSAKFIIYAEVTVMDDKAMDEKEKERLAMEETERMHQFVSKLIDQFAPRTKCPSYRYYYKKDSKDRYFWTTEPLQIRQNGAVRKRWASGVYKYKKGRKMWTLRSKCYHATRCGAKLRADRLLENSKKKTMASPQANPQI